MDNAINDTIKRVECLGALGDVDESLKLLKKVDGLKEEKSKVVVSLLTLCFYVPHGCYGWSSDCFNSVYNFYMVQLYTGL